MYQRIRDAGRSALKLDPSQIANALGAEAARTNLKPAGGPLSLFQLRHELLRRLQSSGGRPALAEASRRVKIPLNEKQWEDLKAIAAEVASPGFSPSPGQIASVLIALSLRPLRQQNKKKNQHKSTARSPKAPPSANE
jgi:hypothetical protein